MTDIPPSRCCNKPMTLVSERYSLVEYACPCGNHYIGPNIATMERLQPEIGGASETRRFDCPHCSYETNDQAAYEDHRTLHRQVNPNPRPRPGHSMTVDELVALLVLQCEAYMEHAPWPSSDEELKRFAQHLAGNLLMAHEVITKRIAAHISKPHQPRRRKP